MDFSKEPRKEGTTDNEWIWKRNMKIGMWNERSLFWSGAVKVLHNELSNLDFNVVVLQGTQLKSGIQKFDNFALFNSKSEIIKYEFGCGFYVGGEFLKCVKDFKIVNERICCLRLKDKWFSCTLINVRPCTNKQKKRKR